MIEDAAECHVFNRHCLKRHSNLFPAGIHVVYDLSRAPGNRAVSIEVLCTACRVPAYVPLQMDEIYNVTLPSYMLFGGDGYHMLRDNHLAYSKGKYSSENVADKS